MALYSSTARLSQFLKNDDGSATAWSILWSLIFLIIGGLAVDNASAWKTQQELQAVADAASHAGAVELSLISDASAKTEAVRIAKENIKKVSYGNILVEDDVQTGTWDHQNRVFTPTTVGADAVRVTTRRTTASGNPSPTFLLRLVGKNSWDVIAKSTTQRFIPTCILDGIVANGVAEISSNNSFFNGYCIHGQQGVKISSNNYFEGPNPPIPGVVVSMNDFADLQLPASGLVTNTGLAAALAEDWIAPRVVDRIDEWLVDLSDPANSNQPGFIDPTFPVVNVSNSGFNPNLLVAGTVYNVSCNGNQQLNMGGATISGVVVITSCRVKFGSGSAMQNAIVATSNNNGNSVTASQGLRIGVDDGCSVGGGATLMTAGGISIAAGLEVYGSQVISAGDTNVSAQASGIEGASFQTGGDFKMTSNGVMGNCIGNVDQIVVENYYRIVQ